MGMFLLWATWVHKYMHIFVNIDGHRTFGNVKRTGGNNFDRTWSKCQ